MKNRLEMTPEEYAELSAEHKKLYDFAMAHINDDWARGPYGGWSRAHNALKEIGYTEVTREEGHRTFVHLEKPIRQRSSK